MEKSGRIVRQTGPRRGEERRVTRIKRGDHSDHPEKSQEQFRDYKRGPHGPGKGRGSDFGSPKRQIKGQHRPKTREMRSEDRPKERGGPHGGPEQKESDQMIAGGRNGRARGHPYYNKSDLAVTGKTREGQHDKRAAALTTLRTHTHARRISKEGRARGEGEE